MTDRNGYSPSIMQTDDSCFLCGRTYGKLDRHEVFGGAYRQKSKACGLWVLLCHDGCHLGKNGVHKNPARALALRRLAQMDAMEKYGWSVEDFRRVFGKNYLEG